MALTAERREELKRRSAARRGLKSTDVEISTEIGPDVDLPQVSHPGGPFVPETGISQRRARPSDDAVRIPDPSDVTEDTEEVKPEPIKAPRTTAEKRALLRQRARQRQKRPSPARPQAPPLPPQEEGDTVLGALTQFPAGVVAAIEFAGEEIKDVADYIREEFPAIKAIDPGDRFQVPIPQFEEPKGPVEAFIKGGTQFLTGFLPGLKAASAFKVTGALSRPALAGAISDFLAFDPDDPRLADLIKNLNPDLRNPVIEYLASDPTDSNAEKRFKRALEGAGLGITADLMFRTVKGLLKSKHLKETIAAKTARTEATQGKVTAEGLETFRSGDLDLAPKPVTFAKDAEAGAAAGGTGTARGGGTKAQQMLEENQRDLRELLDVTKASKAADDLSIQSPEGYERVYLDQTKQQTLDVMKDLATRIRQISQQLNSITEPSAQANLIQQRNVATRLLAQQRRHLENLRLPARAQKALKKFDETQIEIRGKLAKKQATQPAAQQGPADLPLEPPRPVSTELFRGRQDVPTSIPAEQIPATTKSLDESTILAPAKYAGSINIERVDSTEGAIKAIVQASKVMDRPATVTHQMTVDNALALGYVIEDVDKLMRMTNEQNAHVLAARQTMVTVAEDADRLREIFRASQNEADLVRFREAEVKLLYVFGAVQKIVSEAGRTLSALRIGATHDLRSATQRKINELAHILLSKGKLTDDVTARLGSLDYDNPEQVHTFLEYLSVRGATTADKAFEAFLASILSGPQTHVANIMGNAGTLALRPIERIFSGGIDYGLFQLGIKPRDRFFGEATVDIAGMLTSFRPAIRAFTRTMRTGMASFGTKFEVTEAGSKIGGRTGKFVRTPLRFLSAVDEFFKILAREGDLYAQAYRLGVQRGMKGGTLMDFTANVAQNTKLADRGGFLGTGDAMIQRANDEATYRTFTRELGRPGRAISRLTRDIPVIRYLAPFVRTPINITKFGLERGPLKAFDFIRMWRTGQFPQGGDLSDELGKLAMGIGVTWWVATETLSGNLTGTGPVDFGDRKRLENVGWQPLSQRVLGHYASYSRFEPFATMMGMVATGTEVIQAAREAEIIGEQEEIDLVNGLFNMVVTNITDKTFLQGLQAASDVMSDAARFGMGFAIGRVRPVVPNIIGQAARAQDPELRRMSGIFDGIRAQLPKIGEFEGRQKLFPVRDYYGDAIESQGNFWFKYLLPIRLKEIAATEGQQMIQEAAVGVGRLDDFIMIGNTKHDLTEAQKDRLSVLVGQQAKILVEARARGLNKGKATTLEVKQKELKDAFREARGIGKALFLAEFKKELNARKSERR
jgi:hypothetical protein